MSMNQPPQMPNLMQPQPIDPMEALLTLIATTASRPELNVDVQAKSLQELCHSVFFLAQSKAALAQAAQAPTDPNVQQALDAQDQLHQHQIQQTESNHKMALNADQQAHTQKLAEQNQAHQHQLDLAKLQMQAQQPNDKQQ
jgi:hypothetical protein